MYTGNNDLQGVSLKLYTLERRYEIFKEERRRAENRRNKKEIDIIRLD